MLARVALDLPSDLISAVRSGGTVTDFVTISPLCACLLQSLTQLALLHVGSCNLNS